MGIRLGVRLPDRLLRRWLRSQLRLHAVTRHRTRLGLWVRLRFRNVSGSRVGLLLSARDRAAPIERWRWRRRATWPSGERRWLHDGAYGDADASNGFADGVYRTVA